MPCRAQGQQIREIWNGQDVRAGIHRADSAWVRICNCPGTQKRRTLWFLVDYRNLNTVTVPNSYANPRMKECIDPPRDTTMFSTLDANCCCCLLEIAKGDREKTAFSSNYGLFQFICMPFWLKNVQGTFHRAMDVILLTFQRQLHSCTWTTSWYFLKSPETHIKHVWLVLTILLDACVTVKLKKCDFNFNRISYLEHIIPHDKCRYQNTHWRDLGLEAPYSYMFKIIPGLVQLLPRFASNLARIVVLLNRNLQKEQKTYFQTLP